MKKFLFCLTIICLIIINVSPASAQMKLNAGKYSNFYSAGVFSLNMPEGFRVNQHREKGVLLENREKKISIAIQCTKVDHIDPGLFERLHDEAYQEIFAEGLSRSGPRTYNSWRLLEIGVRKVFQFTAIDETGHFSPIRSFLFQKNGREFFITLETETPAQLEEYDYLMSDLMENLLTQ